MTTKEDIVNNYARVASINECVARKSENQSICFLQSLGRPYFPLPGFLHKKRWDVIDEKKKRVFEIEGPQKSRDYDQASLPFTGPVFHKSSGGSLLGWPKSPFSFFCKIEDTFFTITNNLIDLDILTMLTISHSWLLVGRGQGWC